MSCQNRKRSLGKTGSRCMPPRGVAIAAWRSAGSIRTASPDYINIERDERAAAEVLRINRGMHSVPTIVFPDGSILVEPRARTGRHMLTGTRTLARRTPETSVQKCCKERELAEAFPLVSFRVHCIHVHRHFLQDQKEHTYDRRTQKPHQYGKGPPGLRTDPRPLCQ